MATLAALVLLALPADPAFAQAAPADPAQQLADRYAPRLELKEQTSACDEHGEPYVPMTVEAVLDNPQIALRQVGNGDPVVKWGPSAADIAGLGEGFYLDFPGSSLSPGCIYERDSRRYSAGHPDTVYAHIATQADRPDRLVLQYWFYWYYNDWNNKHEGDWEGIQLVFRAASPDEALQVGPEAVGYAQHEGGERASWEDAKLHRVGEHPVVYSSAGSHASYFGSALYLGRSGSEGFGCDNTDGPSRSVDPRVVVLPDRVSEPSDRLAWLSFSGRWGERHEGPFNAPTGPAEKARWDRPLDWQDGLRGSSVVVPTGDSQATAVVGAFCGAVEFGSNQLLLLSASPVRALLSAAVACALALFLVRRTSWSQVEPTPIVRRRRAGQLARAAPRVYRGAPAAFAAVGLASLPIALVAGLLAAAVAVIPVLGDVVLLSEVGHGANLVLALTVGGLANLVALLVVTTAVAWMMHELSAGRRPSARRAFVEVGRRSTELARGFVRAGVLVVALLASVVGTPVAIWLLVRAYFLPQAVVVDRLDGRGALGRSAALVKGRWWHTALVAGVINLMPALVAGVAGVFLLLAARLPFWLLSMCVAFVQALLVPLAAIAATLLYGDARAEASQRVDGTARRETVPSADRAS